MRDNPSYPLSAAFRTLTYALVLYAVVAQVSLSATYFPHAAVSFAAAYIWFRTGGERRIPVRMKPLMAVLALQVVWHFITRIVNDKPFALFPLEGAWNFLPLFLLWGLPCDQDEKIGTVQKVIRTLLAVSVLFILMGILQSSSGLTYPLPRQFVRDGKFYGLFDYYIHAGSFFGAIAVFTLGLLVFWDTSLKRKILLGIGGMILVTGVVMSYSRAYYLAVLMATILMLFRKNLRTAAIGGLLVVFISAGALAFFPSVRDRALSIADLKENRSNLERIHLMEVAMTIVSDHPVAGVGYKEWSRSVGAYTAQYREWKFSDAVFSHAHNMYLTVAAETGLVGLALFTAFWTLLLIFLLRPPAGPDSFPRAVSLGAGYALLCMIIGAFFDDNLQKPLDVFLMVLLISLSFFMTDRDTQPERAGPD